MAHAPNSLYQKVTRALIAAEGGRRFCSSCRRLKDAITFRKCPTKRGAMLKCGDCAGRNQRAHQ